MRIGGNPILVLILTRSVAEGSRSSPAPQKPVSLQPKSASDVKGALARP